MPNLSKNSPAKSSQNSFRRNEHGGTTAKFLLVVIGLFLIGHGGFNYMMVWYQCSQFKDKMNEIVTQAYAMPNQGLGAPDVMREKLRKYGNEYGVPVNALIKAERQASGTVAQAAFTRDVDLLPFNLYKFKYNFDYTAKPPSLFEIK